MQDVRLQKQFKYKGSGSVTTPVTQCNAVEPLLDEHHAHCREVSVLWGIQVLAYFLQVLGCILWPGGYVIRATRTSYNVLHGTPYAVEFPSLSVTLIN